MTEQKAIKISSEAYKELMNRKIKTDVPITKQIDKLLGVKNGKKSSK